MTASQLAFVLPALLALAGCSAGTTAATAAGVGPAGGTVAMVDGTSLAVPKGALAATEQVTLEETTLTASDTSGIMNPAGTAYLIGPSLTFAAPATVTLTVDPQVLSSHGDMMSDVQVALAVGDRTTWTFLPTTVKDATHVTAQTTQLGTFVASVPLAIPLSCGPAPQPSTSPSAH